MKSLYLFTFLIFISLSGFCQGEQAISLLQILDVRSGQVTTIREFPYTIEAPFFTKDGNDVVYNSNGKLYRLNIHQPDVVFQIPTGSAQNCNNDHVLSLDGRQIGISDQSDKDRKSRIYIIPLEGGEPRLVTPLGPSYLHGWSPDGATLTYCAERDGNYDVYTIPIEGGEEQRLTSAEGLDDGPEYSPDGKYIWYNSSTKDEMQIWRMRTDGSDKTQMTFLKDEYAWFPHVSPNGKQVVFLTYHKGDLGADEHLPNKNVMIRVMSAKGKNIKILTRLFGGQGTMNVNSWSPDSKKIAFVSYKLIKQK